MLCLTKKLDLADGKKLDPANETRHSSRDTQIVQIRGAYFMANRCSEQDDIRTHLHDAVHAFLMADADLCRQPNERLPNQELVPRFTG